MQETTEQLSTTPATDELVAAARTAGDWSGEPLLHDDEDPGQVLAAGTARRNALNEALAEIKAGNEQPSSQWKVHFALMLGLPMAPSVLLQMVGEQVATHVRATLQAAFPDRFSINPDGPVRNVEEIRDAVLEALADEVGHLLEEGVVASPKDVDAALLLGAGFPFFMGGLTPYLRENGYTFELTARQA